MTRRAPYFHVYIGLMMVFASYAMGVTIRNGPRPCRVHTVASRQQATAGLCHVRVSETVAPTATAPGIPPDPRSFISVWETTGFSIGRGKALIFFERSFSRTFNDERPWTVTLIARFPGLDQAFPLKIEKYSEENRIALCSFTQPDNIQIPNPLLKGTAQLPADGEPLRFIGYPWKENREKAKFDSSELMTARAVAKKVYAAEKFKNEDPLITLDYEDWNKAALGALVLNKRKQVVGILSVHPPGFCGIRDRYVFPLGSILKNLEDVAAPTGVRDTSPQPSETSSSAAR